MKSVQNNRMTRISSSTNTNDAKYMYLTLYGEDYIPYAIDTRWFAKKYYFNWHSCLLAWRVCLHVWPLTASDHVTPAMHKILARAPVKCATVKSLYRKSLLRPMGGSWGLFFYDLYWFIPKPETFLCDFRSYVSD